MTSNGIVSIGSACAGAETASKARLVFTLFDDFFFYFRKFLRNSKKKYFFNNSYVRLGPFFWLRFLKPKSSYFDDKRPNQGLALCVWYTLSPCENHFFLKSKSTTSAAITVTGMTNFFLPKFWKVKMVTPTDSGNSQWMCKMLIILNHSNKHHNPFPLYLEL